MNQKVKIKNMNTLPDSTTLRQLMTIPGIGKSIAKDLYAIGIRRVEDLKGKNPETLFQQSNQLAGCIQDRCLLYTFRCAVYFAETPADKQEAEKLKWWNWKDKKYINQLN